VNFRKDINGLRALAVISVVLFHFFPELVPGGFIGVDIFFVISGFLMTSIIYNGLSRNTFNIFTFYLGRARRILPALIVLCSFLLIYGWFTLLPSDYEQLAKHAASSVTFLSNFIYFRESGYFSAGAHEKWLLHTWSLSVEWQFYILYPIAIIALKRVFGLSPLRNILLCSTGLLFIFSVYSSYRWPTASYFLLPTRSWEMMAGGLIFLFPFRASLKCNRFFEFSGLFLIFISLLFTSEKDAWPGFMALLPVCGTLFIMFANNQQSKITGNKFTQCIGKISYSLYLWHWPIVVYISYLGYSDSFAHNLGGLLISIVFGFISYEVVERKLSTYFTLNSFSRVLLTTLPVISVSIIIFFKQGIISDIRPISVSEQALFIEKYKVKHQNLREAYWLKCNGYAAILKNGIADIDDSCTAKSGSGGVFLWGDSHAEALSYGLRTTLSKSVPFSQVTSAGCKPNYADSTQRGDLKVACDSSNQFALKKISEIKPEIVIVAQANEHELVDWEKLNTLLKNIGVSHVILSGPLPQWLPSLPVVVAKRHWNDEKQITDASLDSSIVQTNQILSSRKSGVSPMFINVLDELCSFRDSNYYCLVRLGEGNSLITVDYGHLSREGSKFVVKNILYPKIEPLLAQRAQ